MLLRGSATMRAPFMLPDPVESSAPLPTQIAACQSGQCLIARMVLVTVVEMMDQGLCVGVAVSTSTPRHKTRVITLCRGAASFSRRIPIIIGVILDHGLRSRGVGRSY